MATYRNVQLSFWTDSKVADDFTPEDKYCYLYMLTNPHTNLSGCYELSIRQMAIETGYSKDSVEKLLDRMEKVHRVIKYSKENKELLIVHWAKYNWSLSPKVKKSIEDNIAKIKTPEFKAYVYECYLHIDTVSIGYEYPINILFSLGIGSCLGSNLDINNNYINNMSISEKEELEKEQEKQHSKEVDDFFESIWKLYIRKEGKNGVNKSAKEEIFNVGYERMKKCIEHYAELKAGNDKKYLLMGSTFFNGRYKDYLEDEVETKEESKNKLPDRYADYE